MFEHHSTDPTYYANNEDGSESHGYWLKGADYEEKQLWSIKIAQESIKAVEEGRACDLQDAPGYLPF